MEKENDPFSTITFGKYKNQPISNLLKDRKYCKWLLEEEWFRRQYGFLCEILEKYRPLENFLDSLAGIPSENSQSPHTFLSSYRFFNLLPPSKVRISLSQEELACYTFYLETISSIKNKIETKLKKGDPNPFNIKAPSAWLKKFEERFCIPRESLKTFLSENELPSIAKIFEDVKKEGGLEYKGAKAFLIAKERSLSQEAFWEKVLKSRYPGSIAVQYKHEDRFYDFLNVKNKVLYECKLGLKDYDPEQHDRYIRATGFKIIYLISKDCIIDTEKKVVYRLNSEKQNEVESKAKKKTQLKVGKKLVEIDSLLDLDEKKETELQVPKKLEDIILEYTLVKIDKLEDGLE